MSLDARATELVTTAHKRQLAMRFEVSAFTAAVAAGHTTTVGQQAYALTWLAEYAAGRILDLSQSAATASRVAQPGPAPCAQSPQGRAGATPPAEAPIANLRGERAARAAQARASRK